MGRADSELTAFDETVVFLDYFKDLPDPRQAGKVIYPLPEVLLLCLLAVLAGAETFVDIARFGEKKLDLLRRFRPFLHGTPAHDHLGDILSVLDAEQFERCFVNWVAALTGAPREVIAIDGKTLRRSGAKKDAQAAVHMVSAFAAHQRLVLGQVRVADKSNETVAIPKLLDLLALKGAVVTIDAIGCQREIARKIFEKKADYVLAAARQSGCPARRCRSVRRRAEGQGLQGYKASRGTKPSTATTAASRPGPTPRSTTWIGSRSATTGRRLRASSWSKAPAKSATRSSAKLASTSPRLPNSPANSAPSSAATGRSACPVKGTLSCR